MPGDVPAPLEPLRDRPAESALFLDFDGTLAPIVADPAGARPLPGVPAALERLAGRFSLVAVVSGRPVTYLAAALGPLEGVTVIGLYGMETAGPGGEGRLVPEAERWRPVVTEVTARALQGCPAGAGVEPKGLTVALHWRNRPDAQAWATAFARAEAAETGLIVQPGRMALELRPPIDTDKGTVVRRLGRGHAAVACFGDDLGDLPAFEALTTLAAGGAAVARVAVVDGETPPEVAAAADVVVEGTEGALRLLTVLAGDG
jgi:trehalose 6-phosphate phosphatase